MDATKHTPTPVKGSGFNPNGGGFEKIYIGEKSYPAGEVAKRVNAHDDLVAAIKQLRRMIVMNPTNRHCDAMERVCDEALSKANPTNQ